MKLSDKIFMEFRNVVLCAKEIPAKKIVTGNWVRMKCRYGCSFYGKSCSCPPEVPEVDECRKVLSEYKTAMLLRFGTHDRKKLERTILDIERRLFLSGYYKAFGFFVSPCTACKKCNPRECRHPEKSRPTAESFGIDLIRTSRNAGFEKDILKENEEFLPVGLVLVD